MSISVSPRFNPAAVAQPLLPGQTCAFDIGSITLQFRSLYLNKFLSLLSAGGIEKRLQESAGALLLTDAASTELFRWDSSGFIIPSLDKVALTVKGFAGGTSDVLDIFDAASPQNLVWKFTSTGDLVFPLFSTGSSPAIKFISGLTINQTFMQRSVTGVAMGAAADTPAINWSFFGDIFSLAGVTLAKLNIMHAVNNDNIYDASSAGTLIFSAPTRVLQIQASSVQNLNNAQFLSLRLENLTVDPVPAFAGRIFERTDLKQVSWDDGSAIHRLIDTSPSGVNQTILPLSNNIALTIKGFAGGTSDVLDIFDAASPQNLFWQFKSTGDLVIGLSGTGISPAIRYVSGLTINQVLAQRAGITGITLGSGADSPAITWTVFGDIFNFTVTLVRLNIMHATNNDNVYDASILPNILFGAPTRALQIQATNIQNINNAQFLSLRLENLTVDPAPANAGRVFDRTDLVQLSWDTGVAIRRILDTASTIPFSSITPAIDLNVGDYEVDTGRFIAGNKTVTSGFWLRSAALGTLKRAITFQDVGPVHEVAIGDSSIPALIAATYIDNSIVPWRQFVPDTEVNVTNTSEGIIRRHSTGHVPQFVSKPNVGANLYKSMTLLWETGTVTGDGVSFSFAVTFLNAQTDANYFVHVEEGVTPIAYTIVSKANTGFTISYAVAPGLGDPINWFAVRYGL